ncbi:MAG: transglycosylase SLT domain-containing protein [Deltaproteobacteria bacterium]|uniref:lytic transglycosylase domain-containing protein n=1 Tax=Desulfobacula sp. TaxID=2593537 RepID=UPI0019AC524F|nr:transglycosylase SLT domain-containing protein [Candidatus Desulfobacula maris]MBL6992566.1 transglycosylase SLT domain-containing protein [Desulfobacula sp.]
MTTSYWRVLNRNNRSLKTIMVLISLCICFSLMAPLPLLSATTPDNNISASEFPIYPSIKPNVEFWIDIFTKYSKSQGVIHDIRNLGIIYDVVSLDASATARAIRENKQIKKAMIKKYKDILLNLSQGKKPLSKEEKRVAALFGPSTNPSDFKNAAFNIRCQTGIKEQFKAGLIRSGTVIDEFKRIFRSYGLPVDLIYLPCVESSYNFSAYSKFGAAGIWQFTHSTGRQYMKIGYVVDERRDPYISTDAAARLLKKNYAELKEWPLAITAYNHGRAGMMRAKKSKGSYEKIFKSYHSRSFKFASRNFYSEFLAARIIAKNPKKYFGDIVLKTPVTFQVLKTKGYLPIKELFNRLNISIQDIQTLNPSLRKPVFNGQKYIPRGFSLKFPETLTMHDINKHIAALYKDKQKPSRFHRVQKGDTAGAIARLHFVKLHDLILANGLNRGATIYIGQNLRLPVKDEIILAKKEPETPKNPEMVTKKMRVKEKKVLEPLPELLAQPVKDKAYINPNIVTSNLKVFQTYSKGNLIIGMIKVETEETLGHYADWLQIPTREIRALNGFKYGTPISIDQKIKISMRKKTILEFEEQRYEYHKEIEEDFFESFLIQGIDIYVVKNGDNIWTLCLNELEIPFWLLRKYNPEMNFNYLQPLQKIKYPIVAKL